MLWVIIQLSPSVKYLEILETLGKNLGKILTKSAKNMYDLARSCQELQEKCLIFSTQKTHKKGFSTKNLSGKTKNLVKKSKKCQESCQEIQEMPRILPRNPGKPKNRRENFKKFSRIVKNFKIF